MLRLPPSQIGLAPIDIACHVGRIPFHKSTRTLPHCTRELVARGQAYANKRRPGHDDSIADPYSCPSSSPTNFAADSITDESILARDAVPERDRMFWKRVVAQAGSSSNSHSDLNPRLSQLEPTMTLAEMFAAATAARSPDNSEDASRPEPSPSDEEYNDHLTGDEGDQCDQLQRSDDWVQHHVSERRSFAEGRDLFEDRENHHGATAYGRFVESDQADLTSVEEDDSDAESKSSNQMDLDGSAEGRVPYGSGQPSLTSNLSALQIGEPVRSSYLPGARVVSETTYGSSDGDETPTLSSSGISSNDESTVPVPQRSMFPRSPGCRTGLTLAAMGGRSSTNGDGLNSSCPSSPLEDESGGRAAPSSTEIHGRRSSNLPRSRLHISHAAASSSPDKHGGVHAFHGVGLAQETSLIGDNSRDRRTYRPRNEGNSLVESEMDGAVGDSYCEDNEDPMSDGEHTELTSSPPEPVYDDDVDVGYFSREQHSLWPQSPLDPHTTADMSGNLQSPGICSSPGLHPDALPPPFSASARTVSFNQSLPSSPASQYFSPLSTPLRSSHNLHEEAASPNQFNIVSRPSLSSLLYEGSRTAAFHARLAELADSSEASQSSTPVHETQDRPPTPIMPHEQPPPSSPVPRQFPRPPPRTPRSAMRVFDDRLPASTQPQTSRYFQREQLPPDATWTEPTAHVRAAHARNRYVTPTNRLGRLETRTPSARIERRLFGWSDSPGMGSDYMEDEEQENTSVEEELARRLETLWRWRQVAEREREDREGRLESTPPREERFGWD